MEVIFKISILISASRVGHLSIINKLTLWHSMFRRVHNRSILSSYTLSSCLSYSTSSIILEFENWISWWLPWKKSKLLNVDNSVAVHDFLTKGSDFILVHRPNFIESIFIAILKSFKLLLKHKEIIGKLLVIFSVSSILLLVVLSQSQRCSSYSSPGFLRFS